MRHVLFIFISLLLVAGCRSRAPVYGSENMLFAPDGAPRTWAVAPAINLSGQPGVDGLLQADAVYEQLQQVRGIVVVPVNRVVEVYVALGIDEVRSIDQAYLVCDQLGVDALVVPTITAYSPYDPPVMGAALQVFLRQPARLGARGIDPRELARQATPTAMDSLPVSSDFYQAAGLFDASAGSTRARLELFASGRVDPRGAVPGIREFLLSMDRYSRFVWYELTDDLLRQMEPQ